MDTPIAPRPPDTYLRLKRLDEAAVVPSKAHETDACFDLTAVIPGGYVDIWPGQVKAVGTGWAMTAGEGWEIQVRSRSGLAKKGVAVANGVGTVDADYRGEVMVLLTNGGSETYRVSSGDRIAQFAVLPVTTVELVLTEALPETKRGTGGFGSSGK